MQAQAGDWLVVHSHSDQGVVRRAEIARGLPRLKAGPARLRVQARFAGARGNCGRPFTRRPHDQADDRVAWAGAGASGQNGGHVQLMVGNLQALKLASVASSSPDDQSMISPRDQ